MPDVQFSQQLTTNKNNYYITNNVLKRRVFNAGNNQPQTKQSNSINCKRAIFVFQT